MWNPHSATLPLSCSCGAFLGHCCWHRVLCQGSELKLIDQDRTTASFVVAQGHSLGCRHQPVWKLNIDFVPAVLGAVFKAAGNSSPLQTNPTKGARTSLQLIGQPQLEAHLLHFPRRAQTPVSCCAVVPQSSASQIASMHLCNQ